MQNLTNFEFFPTCIQGILVENPSQSPACENQADLDYMNALSMSILFYEAQMAGPLPDWHRVPWRGDSTMLDGCNLGIDLSGGFFDAGDHLKFTYPMSFSMNVLIWGMLEFGAGYQQAGEWQNSLNIVKHGLDYLKNAHHAPNRLIAQVGFTPNDHQWWGRPEELATDRLTIYELNSTHPGADVFGQVAATFASGALLYKNIAKGSHFYPRSRLNLKIETNCAIMIHFRTLN